MTHSLHLRLINRARGRKKREEPFSFSYRPRFKTRQCLSGEWLIIVFVIILQQKLCNDQVDVFFAILDLIERIKLRIPDFDP